MIRKKLTITKVMLSFGLLFFSYSFAASIDRIDYGKNTDGNFEIQFSGSDLLNVRSFNFTTPASIIVDIPNATSNISKNTDINLGDIQSVAVIQGDDRVRATIRLSKMNAYDVKTTASKVSVIIKQSTVAKEELVKSSEVSAKNLVSKVDFQKGTEKQGVVNIKFNNDTASVNVDAQGSKIIAKIEGASIPKSLRKQLKVTDFGTPVKSIDVFSNRIEVETIDDNYKFISYQSDSDFVLEFSEPIEKESKYNQELTFGEHKVYSGEPLSLNFQDIQVRAVLQLIADFTGTNIVVSDQVNGNITLRLNNVPWDQAMDIILKTKGLSKRKSNDVIYIAPTKDLVAQETQELEGLKKTEELAPLRTELVQVQYARAEALEQLIRENQRSGTNTNTSNGFLSSRGTLSVDERTNTILIQDVPSRIEQIRDLIAKLDVPVNQVLIDSRIVAATDSFTHELGVQFGGAFVGTVGDALVGGAGSLNGADTITSSGLDNILDTGQAFPTSTPSLSDRLGVALPASNATGAFGISVLASDFLLDLELSASQQDGRTETISSPRVITQDGTEASVQSGEEIPYTTRDDDGTATVEYKDAKLSLNVTPKIAPNHMVDMIIKIDKDTRGADVTTLDGTVPSINTNGVETKVLVENGQTVVLGGVYEQRKSQSVSKVPLLGDIPVVGRLFRKDTTENSKNELLIFITPRIIDKKFITEDKFSTLRNN